MHDIILALAWLLALAWCCRSIQALVGLRAMIDLTEIDENSLPQLPNDAEPHLSVIVPARDEIATIQETLRSLLAQTGIRLQIVAVDDRSSDGTGEKMDALLAGGAASPHRFAVLHVRELPSGWLGKPHALAQGVQHAKVPWLLFTDGDILFEPEALHLALRTAIREKADHFVLAPTLLSKALGEKAIQSALQALAHFLTRAWKLSDPKAKDAFGVGGFTLVRSEALDAIGGMERLRMEVVEDVALGWLIKREQRRRSLMVLGPGLVQLRWLHGTFGIVRLLEKNAFAGTRYSVTITLIACASLLLHALVPFAALFAGPWGVAASLFTYFGIGLGIVANRKLNGLSPWLAVLFAPSVLIVVWAFLRSLVLTLARGGVVWRGTFYPLADLKRNMIAFRMGR